MSATAVRRALAAAALLALLTAPLLAEGWHGGGHASGTVVDVDDKPIAGATVTLRLPDETTGPSPATTDARGRWALLGLAGGRWNLTVEAPGYIHAVGIVEVPESGPAPALQVQLRPLTEVTPGGPENPQAVFLWIDKGNSLLAQGKPAEARAEYEKALKTLPPEQRPDIYQGVARSWFLQGDLERAAQAVQAGLRIEPNHKVLRQLLPMLLEDLGRPQEATAFLAALDAGTLPPQPQDEEADGGDWPPEIKAIMAAAPEAPVANRTGSYKVAFTERSPRGARDEVLRRSGTPVAIVEKGAPQALRYDLAKESFQVQVPTGEPPAKGWGLFVWISPGPFGGAYRPERVAALAKHHLIWIGANASGNDRNRWDRWGLALDAVWNMQRLYKIDPERVFVGGYSGGGRAASALTMLYPDVFRAGLMQMGVDWFRDLPVPDRPGTHWPAPFAKPDRELYRLAKERARWVLLTGERDFNRVQTRVIRAEMEKEGFRGVTYLEVPGASHYDPIPADWLEKAYAALDSPAASSPASR
ncbi:MAG TPA: carboxypeptidase regulatory-like domain-containing protein [Thermoanaerobaculia bacterium]|nr:carboxypeptidase regulatory-like domain-containing protein [Thermoanaerobaculia bacterium]